jgi:hypothetical protein
MLLVDRLRPKRFAILLMAALLLGVLESVLQYREVQYLRSVSATVVRKAHAHTPEERVVALRDYLRATVRFQGAPTEDRPFMRATAANTLRSGLGYCGEVTRVFICMAASVGVRAQRINLYGKEAHVVAEAQLAPGKRAIVDCQNPPRIAGLVPLDRVILRPEYSDYSTLNLRRLRLNWLVSRLKLEMGPLTYWTENPHLLKATFWFLIGATLLSLRVARQWARRALRRAGWVHGTDLLTHRLPSGSTTTVNHVLSK